MAHRADIIQVHRDFPQLVKQPEVTDPNCGLKMAKNQARSVIYREKETLYFCSRVCREEYLTSKKHKPMAA